MSVNFSSNYDDIENKLRRGEWSVLFTDKLFLKEFLIHMSSKVTFIFMITPKITRTLFVPNINSFSVVESFALYTSYSSKYNSDGNSIFKGRFGNPLLGSQSESQSSFSVKS